MYSMHKPLIRYIIREYFLSFHPLSFQFLHGILSSTDVFNFDEV